jgi:acetyl esterase/lipase
MTPSRSWLVTGAWILLGSAVLLTSCKRADANTDRNLAAEPLDDLTITRDISYAQGLRHSLDVYVSKTGNAHKPVVLFIYGGTWMSGAKADSAWVGAVLARKGYVVVIPDYRIYPEGAWPEFLQDNAQAVRWARDNAARYGGDASNLVIMGHSAGAYNAVSLAVDPRWLHEAGLNPEQDVKAVIGLSGPYIIQPDSRKLKAIFGPRAQWPDTQPFNHIDGRSPPLLLITGDKDDQVGPEEGDKLAALVHAKGGSATVVHYPALSHGGTLDALAPGQENAPPVMDEIAAFIEKPRD